MYNLRFLLLIVYIAFYSYSVQAITYSCNTTAPCGCSKNQVIIDSRIVGGEPAASHSWAWAVSLRLSSSEHFCGGMILSAKYILTAAHCVDDDFMSKVDLIATVGINNLSDKNGQKISVSKIYLHPQWNKITNENDIAVLKLKKAISFKQSTVGKLCLPLIYETVETDFPLVNSKVIAIGWGYTESGGYVSNALQQVTLQVVSNAQFKCRNSIRNSRLQFCAAVDRGGKDTCQGDSGGPLMYYSEIYQQWMIVGITSYGHGCGLSNYAGVYTRVSMYLDWIKSIVGTDGVITVGENGVNGNYMSDKFFIGVLSFLIIIRSY